MYYSWTIMDPSEDKKDGVIINPKRLKFLVRILKFLYSSNYRAIFLKKQKWSNFQGLIFT